MNSIGNSCRSNPSENIDFSAVHLDFFGKRTQPKTGTISAFSLNAALSIFDAGYLRRSLQLFRETVNLANPTSPRNSLSQGRPFSLAVRLDLPVSLEARQGHSRTLFRHQTFCPMVSRRKTGSRRQNRHRRPRRLVQRARLTARASPVRT